MVLETQILSTFMKECLVVLNPLNAAFNAKPFIKQVQMERENYMT